MRIETKGSPEKPALLFLPGMFCTSDSVWMFARSMKTDGFYILPTLNGHYAGAPDYVSKEAEAAQLIRWLSNHSITHLAMIHGTSMGAEVAMEVVRQAQGRITISKCFFDGGPFFHFPWPMRKIMEGKFRQMAKMLQYDREDDALAMLKKIPVIRSILGKNSDKYRPILRSMLTEKRTVSAVTIRNVTDTCYRYSLPSFPKEMQEKMFFLYSDDEPAHMAKKKLQKVYPHAQFTDVKGLGHCGLQTTDPKGYAARLDAFIQS